MNEATEIGEGKANKLVAKTGNQASMSTTSPGLDNRTNTFVANAGNLVATADE